VNVDLVYSDYRKGDRARLDALSYLPLRNLNVIDLDTGKPLVFDRAPSATEVRTVRLGVPVVEDRQSAHIRITGILEAPTYRIDNGDLLFDRTLHGLRNTVLLPAGWDVTAVSQSGTIGTYEGRTFVALINLNAENSFKVTVHARRQK
jgi:hypothetical protein